MRSEKGIRRKLQEELARVNESVVTLKKEPRAQELESFGDTTPLSEEMDSISVGEQKELDIERLGRLLERAAALDEAIHRVDDGTYGVCVSCGARISKRRLKAVPEAARCTKCQSEVESRERPEEPRPAEWEAAQEIYERREAFDEKGFTRQGQRIEDVSRITGEGS